MNTSLNLRCLPRNAIACTRVILEIEIRNANTRPWRPLSMHIGTDIDFRNGI